MYDLQLQNHRISYRRTIINVLKVQRFRNKIAHSTCRGLSETDFKTGLTQLLYALEDNQWLKKDKKAKQAVKDLKEVRI